MDIDIGNTRENCDASMKTTGSYEFSMKIKGQNNLGTQIRLGAVNCNTQQAEWIIKKSTLSELLGGTWCRPVPNDDNGTTYQELVVNFQLGT